MLPNLLFECIMEEIPPKMQNNAVIQIKNYIDSALNKGNIRCQSTYVFITARRFVILVNKLDAQKLDEEIKGPNINASKKAIEGFLRKTKKNIDELLVREIKNEKFYFACNINTQINLEEFFKKVLEEMLKGFPWPKSMRWGNVKERWIRPIQSMLCILDDKVIPVIFADVVASNVTFGHRFLSTKKFNVSKTDDYLNFLDENYVILDQNKRKEYILKQIRKFEIDNKLQLEANEKLLDELNGLVEYPIVLFGKVGDFDLPIKVISSVICSQQKYLILSRCQDNEKKISYFATVVSVINDQVIQGYEKVLSARLTDAQFFVNQDKKYNLDYYSNKLNLISFHDHLGSVAEKVKRITALAKYIAIWVPLASLLKVEWAAMLAKADLATSMVREFPELQGVMGGYYASCFNEDKEVIDAITNHYLPLGPKQNCPSSATTIAIALADKVDNLIGFAIAGEKFSSSSDPFALRRNAIGLIRIILENNLNISINLLLDKSASLYPKSLFSKKFEGQKLSKKQAVEIVFRYCLERFKVILKETNIPKNIIESIPIEGKIINLLNIKEKAIILNDYIETDNGKRILSTYKRISNMLSKSHAIYQPKKLNKLMLYSTKSLIEREEIALLKHIKSTYKNMKCIKDNFIVTLDELAGFHSIVNDFMDNIQINCDSEKLRRNRIDLIIAIHQVFNLVADFSKV
ncbi:glycine--tRNA ligase subunit beta [Candidatus Mesenet endosymbiont of Agriotes lineatus]|uniref:glycine--tRNA ligase subunit beta n=1 Tax=Candidatus Mesenet endosymbiont of Agriotes lineatus TaxID=3077948 RepID=UPI0030CAF8D9